MNKEFVITGDGSHTIYIPEMDEHYHSTHGAIQESLHIYINNGLLQFAGEKITILEIGFGTGLNAFLTAIYSKRHNISVKYISIEKFPLTEKEYTNLNYAEGEFKEYSALFDKIHQSSWEKNVEIEPSFILLKIQTDLVNYQFDPIPNVDLVYYDAFAPNKQPDLWSDEVIEKVCKCITNNGLIVTYCAKGTIRRTIASFGFEMERLPGPPGKKEILRGKKLL